MKAPVPRAAPHPQRGDLIPLQAKTALEKKMALEKVLSKIRAFFAYAEIKVLMAMMFLTPSESRHAIEEGDARFFTLDGWRIENIDSNSERDALIYVNGMRTDLAHHLDIACRLTDAIEQPIVLLHNGTTGLLPDLLDVIHDRYIDSKGDLAQAVAHLIVDRVQKGKPVHFIAHSHGTSLVLSGIRMAAKQLQHQKSEAEVQALLSLVKVELLACIAPSFDKFESGPKYIVYLNVEDPIAVKYGPINRAMIKSKPPKSFWQTKEGIWVYIGKVNLAVSPDCEEIPNHSVLAYQLILEEATQSNPQLKN